MKRWHNSLSRRDLLSSKREQRENDDDFNVLNIIKFENELKRIFKRKTYNLKENALVIKIKKIGS